MSYLAPVATGYAQSQIGFREIPNGSNCNPYSDWQYGVRCPGGGWCMSFASRCTVEGGFDFDGATHGDRGFSFTESAEAWARDRGLWRDRNWRASPGDWVIFEFGGGYPTDHGEVVLADDGALIVTIGGNTSNAVMFRKRDRTYVVGFVAFSQSDQVAAPPPPPPKVRPMFDPPLPETARLANPDGGWWLGYDRGRVDFLPADGSTPLIGGMIHGSDPTHFAGKHLARLKHRTYIKDGVQKQGYTIVATDGTTYVPAGQR